MRQVASSLSKLFLLASLCAPATVEAVCIWQERPMIKFSISEIEPNECPCVNEDGTQSKLKFEGCFVRAKAGFWPFAFLFGKPGYNEKMLTFRKDICEAQVNLSVVAKTELFACRDTEDSERAMPKCNASYNNKKTCGFWFETENVLAGQ